MMWLKRKIRDWIDDAYLEDDYRTEVGKIDQHCVAVEPNFPEDIDSYTLRVWKATGGRCIQYKRYDNKNDRLHSQLYVVSDEEDLGEAVTNIVVQQSLQGH